MKQLTHLLVIPGGAITFFLMPIYCLKCKSKNVKETVEENRVIYSCPDCHVKSGQAFIVDGRIKIINTSRGIKHIDVAALIIKDNKILLTERRTYPFGLEIPVGHLEYNETLEQALERELYEEVGLKVSSSTLLAQMEQPVSHCRYGSDIEEWAVFLVEYQGSDFVSNHEIEAIAWFPVNKIPTDRLTAHTRFALQTLGYLAVPATGGAS